MTVEGHSQMVVLETKGLHLAGSTDTDYKRALLDRLSTAYRDERAAIVGTLALDGPADDIVCDLVFDQAWRGTLERRYFN
jgi:type III restriction enzyme